MHFSTVSSEKTARDDLEAIVKEVLGESKVLLSVFFRQNTCERNHDCLDAKQIENLAVCSPPGLDLSYEDSVEEAGTNFSKLFYGKEFSLDKPQDTKYDSD